MKKGQLNIIFKIKSETRRFRCVAVIFILFISNSLYAEIITGAEQTNLNLNKLKGKKVAIVANPT